MLDLPWGEYAVVALWTGLKFFVGLGFALAFRLHWLEQFICMGLGGVAGAYVFAYFGEALRRLWRRLWRRPAPDTLDEPNVAHQRLWRRYGLVGVAVITPFVMPAVAAAVALAFGTPPRRVARALALSMLLWALLFALLADTPVVQGLLDRISSLWR